jgi:hypothetical protein
MLQTFKFLMVMVLLIAKKSLKWLFKVSFQGRFCPWMTVNTIHRKRIHP